MASAKKEAQSNLGSVEDYINLKGLNQERNLANDVYNTNTTSFQNAYNDLLNTISSNRQSARISFNRGRNTVSENAYMQNRANLSDLASRGLNGGIAQLNKLGNRIETGRQFSNLANTYYNTMNELDANEKSYTNQYNTNMETARNELNAALANIDAREKAGRNQYRAAVAQLAEQIQARRDANANAAAALKAQKAANKQSITNAQKQLILDIYSGSGSDADKYIKAYNTLKTLGYSDPDKALSTLSNGAISKPSNIVTQYTRDKNGKLTNPTPVAYTPINNLSNLKSTTTKNKTSSPIKTIGAGIGAGVNSLVNLLYPVVNKK